MKSLFKALTGAATLLCLGLSPAAAQVQSSWLSVSNGQIKDSCGATIVMRGVNHGNVWASNWGLDELPQIAMTGGNTVRLCFERTYESWATGAPVTMNTTAAQVETVIQACLAQKMIPVVELHDWTNYDANNTAAQTLPLATAWWTAPAMLAVLKKYQHWLVLNPANEPEHWDMTEAAYKTANNTAVTALRNAGLSCPIMIDGMHWGQDHQFFLNHGASMLASDPQHKLIFSVHAYWENESDAVITSRMNAMGTSGLPFVIGELAKNNSGNAATTINYQLIMQKCQQYGLGYLGWWWGFINPGSNNGLSFTNTGLYADLAGFGQVIAVTDANAIQNTSVKSPLLQNGVCGATTLNPVVTANGPTTFCAGDSVKLTVAGYNSLPLQWYKNNVAISGATAAMLKVTATGTYLVKVNNSGTWVSSNATAVTANALPAVPIISGMAGVCPGTTITLSTPAVAGFSYLWTVGGANIGGNIPTLTVANAGAYKVKVTNANGCARASATKSVASYPQPINPQITPSGELTLCNGATQVFSIVNPVAGYTYQWADDGMSYGADTGATHSLVMNSASEALPYNVGVWTFNSYGCPASVPAIMAYVDVAPAPVIPQISTATGLGVICSGDSLLLSTPALVAGISYQWKKGGVSIAGATGSNLYIKTAGSYTVTATNSCGASATSPALVATVAALPTAPVIASSANGFCPGGATTLSVTNAQPSGSYAWSIAAGSATGEIPGASGTSYAAGQAGTYTVTYTNGNGCRRKSLGKVIAAYAAPVASITVSPTSNFVCDGSAYTASTPACSGCTYQWYDTDGGFSGLPFSAVPGATAATYTATLSTAGNPSEERSVIVTNSTGCRDSADGVVVAATTLPPAPVISPSMALCTGSIATLTSDQTPMAAIAYQWKRNGANIAGATGVSYTTTVAGTYTLTAADVYGCASTSTGSAITVAALPATPVITSAASGFCPGSTVQLSAPATAGISYQWRLGGTAIAGATGNTHQANAAGSYTVVATNSTGCNKTSAAKSISAYTAPAPLVSFTPAGGSYCQGAPLSLKTTAISGGTYNWMVTPPNFGLLPGSATVALNTAGAMPMGGYTAQVSVTNASGCTGISPLVTFNILAAPIAPVISASGPTTLAAGATVTLSTAAENGLTYQWKKGTANISGATNTAYTASSAGSYTLIAKNGNACTTASNAIVVSMAGGRMSAEGEDGTMNESSEMLSITLSPNPTQGALRLRIVDTKEPSDIRITNLSGQVVYSRTDVQPGDQPEIQLSADLPAGMYILHCQSGGASKVIRFVLNR